MQDPILETSNMYNSAQTGIINICRQKRGGDGLIYAYRKGERDGHRQFV